MSVRFDAAGDYVTRATAPSSTFTVTAWIYLSVDTNTDSTWCRVHDAAASGATVATCATNPDGTGGPNYFTASGSVSNSTGLVVGEWRKVAVSRSGSTGKAYIATVGGATEVDSGTVSTATAAGITFATRSPADLSERFDGRIAYARVWDAELTQSEIEAEWASTTAVKTSNLWASWALTSHTDLTDSSGNGRNLTSGGTLTTEADPPIDSGVTGALAGSLPSPVTGSLAGVETIPGALAGQLPSPVSGQLAGVETIPGALAGQLPSPLAGQLVAAGYLTGEIGGTLPALAGSLTDLIAAGRLTAGTPTRAGGRLTAGTPTL